MLTLGPKSKLLACHNFDCGILLWAHLYLASKENEECSFLWISLFCHWKIVFLSVDLLFGYANEYTISKPLLDYVVFMFSVLCEWNASVIPLNKKLSWKQFSKKFYKKLGLTLLKPNSPFSENPEPCVF